MSTSTPGCTICGRDNDNNTHSALEITGHLSHTYSPASTNADLVAVKTSVLCEVARELESLRLVNPMNGDGSNHMLDKCLAKVHALDGTGLTIHASEDERFARKEKLEADYIRLERENQLRREQA